MKDWVPAMGMIGVLVLLLVLMIPSWLLARGDRRERQRKAAGMRAAGRALPPAAPPIPE